VEIITIPSPGTPEGPCRASCSHHECQVIRARAALRCAHCGQMLGFGTRITDDPPMHLKCHYAAAARRQAESSRTPFTPKGA